MKISVLTLGCKVNKYESDTIIQKLSDMGHNASDALERADAYIINTCAVTSEAERKSRQMIERCRKFNKDAKIYVIGCASQNRPVQFKDKGVTYLQGVAGKNEIVNHFGEEGEHVYALPLAYEEDGKSAQSLTRAYIKVQDGCNKFCTYCIIPYLRGRSRSRKMENVIKEIEELPKAVKEVVLVGIDVADYHDEKNTLIDLLEEVDKLGRRVRLSSLEDNIVSEDFILRLKKLKNFCPHFHLSLQSGSDAVLKSMNRKYTTADFEKTVKLIRENFTLPAITTDVIVGFPTETEEEFQKTYAFIKKIGFADIHIFPYSQREGTVASKLMKDMPKREKERRVRILEELKAKLKENFARENDEVNVLIEEQKDGFSQGYSKNYIKCYFAEDLAVGEVLQGRKVKPYLDGILCESKKV